MNQKQIKLQQNFTKTNYSEFVKDLDIDAFENAIGFEPMGQNSNGENYGQCPDPWGLHKHGDRTGKFSINRNKKVFNCFVCGGGTLVSLAMAIRDCTEDDAVDWMRQFISKSQQTNEGFYEEINNILNIVKQRQEQESLPWFNDNVLLKWQEDDHSWFSERGITDDVRKEYRVGVNTNAVRKNSKGEFTSTTIVLPHFWNDKLVGWQDRWMGDRPSWVPKYTNTNDFPKRTTIFGFDKIKDAVGPIVVVESVPTVLFLASLGIPAVATFGANVSNEQLVILRAIQNGIILAPDEGQAGEVWRQTLTQYLERYIPVMEMEQCWEDDLGEPRMVEHPEVVLGLYNNPVYSQVL